MCIPRANREVRSSVSGAGEIAGVDNGNLDGDEPRVGEARSAYHGTRAVSYEQTATAGRSKSKRRPTGSQTVA